MSDAPDVVYAYTPPATKKVLISLCGTSYDAIVYLVDASGIPVLPPGSFNALCHISVDDADCANPEGALSAVLTQGVKYYFVVDGINLASSAAGNSGHFKLSIYDADTAYSDVYARVLDRGVLRCASMTTEKGFFNDIPGQLLAGFNIDLCRALAAAVFGRNGPDIDTLIAFQTILPASDKAELLSSGEVDVLMLPTTITIGRDWSWGQFSSPYFFDGQSFLVNASAISAVVATPTSQLAVSELNNPRVSYCVAQGAYLEQACALFNLPDAQQVLVADREAGLHALASGACMVLTGAGTWLTAALPQDGLVIIKDVISQEDFGVLTATNSPVWSSIVQWVLHGLILAESLGITRANAAILQPTRLEGQVMLGRVPAALLAEAEAELGRPWNLAPLPLSAEFMQHAILQVGNYGEIYARNVPVTGASGFPRIRTPNALWTTSRGAMYPNLFFPETGEIVQVAQTPRNRGLATVRQRGKLLCGALRHEATVFGKPASGGTPAGGMDVDLCRAVAAAIFNRSTAVDDLVELVTLAPSERRSALLNGTADVLFHELTPTLGRDVAWGFAFSQPYFYDTQAFLVDTTALTPASGTGGALALADIDRPGATCCVVPGTTSELVAIMLLKNATVVQVADRAEGVAGIRSGRCTALTGDRGGLHLVAGGNLGFVSADDEQVALRVPLAAAVADGESDLLLVVNWVIQGLIAAEDAGISQANVATREPTQWEGRLMMGLEGAAPAAFPLSWGFMRSVIEAVGSYGDIYARSVEIFIARAAPNVLLRDGGLLASQGWTYTEEPAVQVDEKDHGGGVSPGGIAGIVIGSVCGAILIVVLGLFVIFRSRKKEKKPLPYAVRTVPNAHEPPISKGIGADERGLDGKYVARFSEEI